MIGRVRASILVVDDDARNRTLIRAMLQGPYSVVEAANAKEAIAALGTVKVDLVLLDVMMPGVSGYEACQPIKATSPEAFLPVLMLTALGGQDERNQGLASGADDYLAKPVDRRELLLRVRAFLRLREQDLLIRDQMSQLRELSSLKDDLVSLMVHDLRNPLAGLRMMLEVLSLNPAGCTRGDVDVAIRTTNQMRDSLEDMLHVRLLENGELTLDRQPHALSEVLRRGVISLEPTARARRVQIRIDAEQDQVSKVDMRLLCRAIENLVVNALKFTPAGETIELRLRPGDSGAEIFVSDRGPGIPERTRLHLFDKFNAVRNRKEDSRSGFGLGLYMVRLVAEAHGGTASVADRAGGGAEFRLLLPNVA